MKKLLMLITVGLAAGFASAGSMSLAEARRQIDDCVSTTSNLTAVVKQLSTADQKTFLGDVVAAVSKMPGSQAELATTYVNVSRAALAGASSDNVAGMVAEIFATVPVEYLPAVSESLSSDMLNRAADPSKTFTDAQYLDVVSKTMETVNKRTETADSSDVRSAFAALTFIRGSNNPSEGIVSAVVATLPESAQKPASTEWFPAALAGGDGKSYDAMLVAASADDAISPDALSAILLNIPAPQSGVMLLSDLAGANTDSTVGSEGKTPISDTIGNTMNGALPALGTGGASDTAFEGVVEKHEKEQELEPEPQVPYQLQNTGY